MKWSVSSTRTSPFFFSFYTHIQVMFIGSFFHRRSLWEMWFHMSYSVTYYHCSLSKKCSAVPIKRGQFSQKYSRKAPHSSPVRVSSLVQALVDILPQLLQWYMQYADILDRVITALHCIVISLDHLHQLCTNSSIDMIICVVLNRSSSF